MKRKLAILLSVVLALGAAPVSAFGAEGCRHHEAHTAECGYSEGTEGTPCTHEHDDSCYEETLLCTNEEEGHEHTADCYEKELVCTHEHGEGCGYSEGEEGNPCEYVCGICEVQALIDALPEEDEITEDMAEEVGDQLIEIDAEKALLSDDEAAELDITPYRAATAALMALNEGTWEELDEEPMLLAETEAEAECQYSLDGGTTWVEGTFSDAIWAAFYPAKDSQIEILKDITLDDTNWTPVSLTNGKKITIDGKGHTIKKGKGYTWGLLFPVQYGGSEVTLKNITIDGGAVWSEGDDPASRTNSGVSCSGEGHLFRVEQNAKLILEENVILQNNDMGKFSYGAAVAIYDGGSLIMNDSVTIRDNTANQGSAVAVISDGEFIMNGGEIYGNYANITGGAVYTSATFTMNDGKIYNNAAGNRGGGVSVESGGVFTMENGEICKNESELGGGVFEYNGAQFTMNNGSIAQNTASKSGGGVHIYDDSCSMNVSGEPVVSDNLSEGKTSNVSLPAGKTITIEGALESSANIGVTLASGETVAAVNGTSDGTDYSGYFTSDQKHKTEKDANGNVQLVAQELPVSINGANFTSDHLTMTCGSGTATLDVGTTPFTLTLNDATITGTNTHGIQTSIFERTDLIIKLVGKNTITTTGSNAKGIFAPKADIKIIGDGSLEITSEDDSGISATSTGINQRSGGNIVISDGAQLKLSGKTSLITAGDELKIIDSTIEGNVVADGYPNSTVLGGTYGVTIDNSKITASTEANQTEGIYSTNGNVTIQNSSEVMITVDRYGIEAKNISITDSTVNAECGSDGWYALYSAGDITMTGGKVTTTNNKGLVGIEAVGNVTVDGTDLLSIGTLRGLKGAQGVTFDNVSVLVSESIDGADHISYDETTPISSYKWVKTFTVTQEATPEIVIDYKDGMLTGFGEGIYLIDGKEVTPENGKVSVDGFTDKTVSIVKKGNGTTKLDSEAQELIIPARPAAPTGVSGGKGVINGASSNMEYRRVSTNTWTPVSGDSVTGLSKGNYEVRVQGTDTAFASEAATVTVTKKGGSSSGGSSSGGGSSSKDEPTYTPKVEESEGGTASVSTKHPEKGDTVTVTPEAEEGFVPEKVIVTDKNGNEIKVTEQEDGTFTFIQPEGAVTVEVIYAEEQPAEQPEQPAKEPVFSDVEETDWYFEAVQAVAEKGFMGDAGENAFLPQQNTTRGMIATILYRMSGESYPDEASIFPDVKEGTYYNPAVVWGTDHSVLRGYDDGLFRPDRPITREELALLIYNFAKYEGLDVSNIEGMGIYEFTDFAEISDWSMTAVRYCVNAGLLSGRDDGSFDPKGLATRAEVASVIQRFLEK